MKKGLILLFVLALVMSIGFVIACGDDDDDDDDDDDADVDKTACHEYHDACLTDTMPENFCAGYYDNQSDCMIEAADALFECLGTDCSQELYDECSGQYEEDALDC